MPLPDLNATLKAVGFILLLICSGIAFGAGFRLAGYLVPTKATQIVVRHVINKDGSTKNIN
jgi:hypothetical protein